MTEADLDRVLSQAARRLRAERAFRAALGALGIGLVVAAAVVLWARLADRDFTPIILGLCVPPTLALATLIVIYVRNRPALSLVALLLDRRANVDEHLVTWHEFRSRPAPENALQRQFLEAQRAATLEKARTIDAHKLFPIHFPDWSRLLLLAFMLLCCAWLAPALDKNSADKAPNERPKRAAGARGAGGGESAASPVEDTPSVEVLSQTDLQRFQLVASDPLLSDARRAEELQKLMNKLGGIPENQLTPLDRQLLNQLRGDGAKANNSSEKKGSEDGTVQNAGGNDPGKQDSEGKVGSAAKLPELMARAMSIMQDQFPVDEQQRLASYYDTVRNTGGERQ
jgi:hypothetical protein